MSSQALGIYLISQISQSDVQNKFLLFEDRKSDYEQLMHFSLIFR